jgi:hypothetical protein
MAVLAIISSTRISSRERIHLSAIPNKVSNSPHACGLGRHVYNSALSRIYSADVASFGIPAWVRMTLQPTAR